MWAAGNACGRRGSPPARHQKASWHKMRRARGRGLLLWVGRPPVRPAHAPATPCLCPTRARRPRLRLNPRHDPCSLCPELGQWTSPETEAEAEPPVVFAQSADKLMWKSRPVRKHSEVTRGRGLPVTLGPAGSPGAGQACCRVPFPASAVERDALRVLRSGHPRMSHKRTDPQLCVP